MRALVGTPARSLWTCLAALAAVLTLGLPPLIAADVSGTVTDETGRRLGGVILELTNVATEVSLRAESDEQGRYGLFSLPPGVSRLTAFREELQKETRQPLRGSPGAEAGAGQRREPTASDLQSGPRTARPLGNPVATDLEGSRAEKPLYIPIKPVTIFTSTTW
jgi:hypothetical protein